MRQQQQPQQQQAHEMWLLLIFANIVYHKCSKQNRTLFINIQC